MKILKNIKKISKKLQKRKYNFSQKLFSATLILTFLCSLIPFKSFGNEETYFVVTAYYSPLPDQKFYLTGDYQKEKRLNGQGIRGASGKPVFSGMLAGPKLYKFGTKIKLDGLGIGAVEDRGGAIVPAGQRGYSYNRIDVWVGYGDEGLRRALYWGKRTIKGQVVSRDTKTTLDYSTIAAPLWATNGLKKPNALFQMPIGKNSKQENIKKLQEFLQKIGLYKGEISGIYNSEVMEILLKFQKENKIIKNDFDYGAAYWGGKTRSLFLKKYLNGDFDKKSELKAPKKVRKEIPKPEVTKKESEKIIIKNRLTDSILNQELNFFNYPAISIQEIKELQSRLTVLGYYDGDINGDNSSIIDSIFDFQVDQLIVNTQYDIGAGTYGPKTRHKMKQAYKIYLKDQEEKRLEKLRAEKRKLELEEKMEYLENLSLKKAEKRVLKIGQPQKGETSPRVRELQILLKELNFLNTNDTAFFGNQTHSALVALQLEYKVIESKDQQGAGIFGPKTKKELIKVLQKKYYQVEVAQLESI